MIIAFDCDGTLEYGVPPGKVRAIDLNLLVAAGYRVYIISDSINCLSKQLSFVQYMPTSALLRWQTLKVLRERFNDQCIYVSDNPGDDIQAKMGGCSYIHPKDWSLDRILAGRY